MSPSPAPESHMPGADRCCQCGLASHRGDLAAGEAVEQGSDTVLCVFCALSLHRCELSGGGDLDFILRRRDCSEVPEGALL